MTGYIYKITNLINGKKSAFSLQPPRGVSWITLIVLN